MVIVYGAETYYLDGMDSGAEQRVKNDIKLFKGLNVKILKKGKIQKTKSAGTQMLYAYKVSSLHLGYILSLRRRKVVDQTGTATNRPGHLLSVHGPRQLGILQQIH